MEGRSPVEEAAATRRNRSRKGRREGGVALGFLLGVVRREEKKKEREAASLSLNPFEFFLSLEQLQKPPL